MVSSAHRRGEVKQAQLFVVVAVITICLAAAFIPGVRALVFRTYETAAFAIAPSAERAYAYGERHFDALQPSFYNMERAEYFFREALARNSAMSFVRHELARIAFLRGDFSQALSLIDAEIAAGPASPSSYYVRGLILGFMGRYDEAAESFETFLRYSPTNWGGVNDYAWVLLKAGRPAEALSAVEEVLPYWPENPWLLNSAAVAANDLGEYEKARMYAQRAVERVQTLTEEEWLKAYPGNDPRIAADGVNAFKEAVRATMHTILVASSQEALQ